MSYSKYLLIFSLLLVLLVSGCGKKTSEKLDGNVSKISNLEESEEVPEREATTHDKIEAALEAGEITKEEAVTKFKKS